MGSVRPCWHCRRMLPWHSRLTQGLTRAVLWQSYCDQILWWLMDKASSLHDINYQQINLQTTQGPATLCHGLIYPLSNPDKCDTHQIGFFFFIIISWNDMGIRFPLRVRGSGKEVAGVGGRGFGSSYWTLNKGEIQSLLTTIRIIPI